MKDIVFSSVYKSFGENKVLQGFSQTFSKGGKYCLMGESGCGKTTLLNLIMGLLQPEDGEITGVPQKVSAVFQEDRLCEDFTPVGNLIAVANVGYSLEKIHLLLDELGLEEHKTKPVSKLSGGQKRRVAIARALLVESEILILDEPFKGLDDDMREKTAETVLSYAAGKTLIVSTHDMKDCQLLDAEIIKVN